MNDLAWRCLDDRNKINLIDTLADYSLDKARVVVTGCNQSELIKKRVYKANIIEL